MNNSLLDISQPHVAKRAIQDRLFQAWIKFPGPSGRCKPQIVLLHLDMDITQVEISFRQIRTVLQYLAPESQRLAIFTHFLRLNRMLDKGGGIRLVKLNFFLSQAVVVGLFFISVTLSSVP